MKIEFVNELLKDNTNLEPVILDGAVYSFVRYPWGHLEVFKRIDGVLIENDTFVLAD
jgi:hypothetical protein